MPNFEVRTVTAQQVWQSPDGQRTLYEVVFDYKGQTLKAKTWSQAIATVGWSGTVETREEPNKNTGALETFVKQPAKEGGYTGGGFKGGGRDSDPFTMYLSYAKDLAVASVETTAAGKHKFNPELYTELLEAAEAGGSQLFASRKEAQAGPLEVPKPDRVITDIPEEGITVEDLGSALDGEPVDAGEIPWPN